MTHIWQGLRSGEWLTARRARGYSLILLGICTVATVGWVMLSDGLTQRQSEEQGTEVEVLDVAQLLLAAVTRGGPNPKGPGPDGSVDALGAGAPGVETTPLPGTQANGAGPASTVSADSLDSDPPR